jgi:hypothetical protein
MSGSVTNCRESRAIDIVALVVLMRDCAVLPSGTMTLNCGDIVVSYEDWVAIMNAALKTLTKETK